LNATNRAPANDGVQAVLLLKQAVTRRRHATLSEAVAADIEALILRGELRNGQRLPTEPELGDALGVSRSVLRDAVRMLVARGLLDVRQGHGTVVSAPSSAAFGDSMVALLMRSNLTVGDVVAARAALETELAPLAARNGTREDWRRMEAHLRRFAEAVDAGRWEEAHNEHLRFHLGLFAALRLPALETLLAPIQQCIVITSFPPQPRRSLWEVEKHPPVLEALAAGDEDRVRAAMASHFHAMETEAYADFRATPFQSAAQLDAYRSFRGALLAPERSALLATPGSGNGGASQTRAPRKQRARS
jgi:GntR family transcriptional regulator, transcriptional repressor for pyruvate dehydrogenase complex